MSSNQKIVLALVATIIFLCSCCCLLAAAAAWGDDVSNAIERVASSQPDDESREPVAGNDNDQSAGGETNQSENACGETFTISVDGEQVELQRDSQGGFYYATGIGITEDINFTLPEGCAFALDADDSMDTAPRDALDDVLIFGDKPGKYSLWGSSSAGLYIAPYGDAPDLAGPAIRNRARAASNWQWPRPVYYYHPGGDLERVQIDPFGQ